MSKCLSDPALSACAISQIHSVEVIGGGPPVDDDGDNVGGRAVVEVDGLTSSERGGSGGGAAKLLVRQMALELGLIGEGMGGVTSGDVRTLIVAVRTLMLGMGIATGSSGPSKSISCRTKEDR